MEYSTASTDLCARIREMSDGKWRTAIRMVDTSLICPNPFHAPVCFDEAEMRSLALKYKKEGIKSPLTIRAVGTAHHPMFHLIAGEKRLRACLVGGITPVPCVVLDADPDRLAETGEIPLPRNYFEEADILFDLITKGGFSEAELAKKLSVSEDLLHKKLSLLEFDATERKLLLHSGISFEHAALVLTLTPANRCEFYRAILNGVTGKDAEELLAPPRRKEKIVIKDVRLFYNTIDKAVAIMQKSGIPVTCRREEDSNTTELFISVPKKVV